VETKDGQTDRGTDAGDCIDNIFSLGKITDSKQQKEKSLTNLTNESTRLKLFYTYIHDVCHNIVTYYCSSEI